MRTHTCTLVRMLTYTHLRPPLPNPPQLTDLTHYHCRHVPPSVYGSRVCVSCGRRSLHWQRAGAVHVSRLWWQLLLVCMWRCLLVVMVPWSDSRCCRHCMAIWDHAWLGSRTPHCRCVDCARTTSTCRKHHCTGGTLCHWHRRLSSTVSLTSPLPPRPLPPPTCTLPAAPHCCAGAGRACRRTCATPGAV